MTNKIPSQDNLQGDAPGVSPVQCYNLSRPLVKATGKEELYYWVRERRFRNQSELKDWLLWALKRYSKFTEKEIQDWMNKYYYKSIRRDKY